MKLFMRKAKVLTCVSKDMVKQYRTVFNNPPHISIYNIGLLWFILGLVKSKKNNFNENNLDVSIIVCVKNGELSLPYILKDLHTQVYPSNIEFIIVDNNVCEMYHWINNHTYKAYIHHIYYLDNYLNIL